MDLAQSYESVVSLVGNASEPAGAWREFLDYLVSQIGEDLCAPLREVRIEADVASVRDQLADLFQREPPPDGIDTLYFGLFDAVGSDGGQAIGYYVAGVQGYDPDDPDSLCDPAWWPDGRYLESKALAALEAAIMAAADHRRHQALLGYAGQLGAAAIVSRFAMAGLEEGRRIVVGFDSGDVLELGEAAADPQHRGE